MHGTGKSRVKYWKKLSKQSLAHQKKELTQNCKKEIISDLKDVSKQLLYNKIFTPRSIKTIFKPKQIKLLQNNRKLLRKLAKTKKISQIRKYLKQNLKGGFLSILPLAFSALLPILNSLLT